MESVPTGSDTELKTGMFGDLLAKLPLIEVEYLEGELRRNFEREDLPGNLVYFDPAANAHRLELHVRNADDRIAADYPIKLSDCSIGGVQATVDHKFRPGARLLIRGRSAKTGEILLQCIFRVRSRRHEVIEEDLPGEEEEVFTFGSLVDGSMAHDERLLFHYGLQFLPDAPENSDDLNLLYKAYLDTLFLAHKLSAGAVQE